MIRFITHSLSKSVGSKELMNRQPGSSCCLLICDIVFFFSPV